MRKLLLILAFPTLAFAGGPKSTFPQPRGLDAEMQNLYHDLANPVINIGSASTMTITQLNVSSIAVTGQIDMGNKKIINQANGSASSDSAAFGQLKIVQVVSTTTISGTSTTSASFVTTKTSMQITPKSSSDSILVFVTGMLISNTQGVTAAASIFRNSTNLSSAGDATLAELFTTTGGQQLNTVGMIAPDSPATTSSITYSVGIFSDGVHTVQWGGSATASMVLLEVAP